MFFYELQNLFNRIVKPGQLPVYIYTSPLATEDDQHYYAVVDDNQETCTPYKTKSPWSVEMEKFNRMTPVKVMLADFLKKEILEFAPLTRDFNHYIAAIGPEKKSGHILRVCYDLAHSNRARIEGRHLILAHG
jgi:hypothetical protein